ERLDLAPLGWSATTPTDVSLDLTSGIPESVSFGNIVSGLILGYKFYDKNMDGYWDDDEPGLDGWVINLDGVTDKGEVVNRTAVTDGTGRYEFVGVQPGEYEITEDLLDDWVNTTKLPQTIDVSGTMAYFEVWVHIGNVRLAMVYGHKFLDTYEDRFPYWPNGIQDYDEIPLGNWIITLQGWTVKGEYVSMVDYTENMIPDVGYYEFTGLLPGMYWVNETMQYGFYATTPVSNLIYVYPFPDGQVVFEIDFGNMLPSPDPEINFVLKAGWNLWSMPLYVEGMRASDLAARVGPNCVKISVLDAVTHMYSSFLPGFHKVGSVYDFAIIHGIGYLISVKADTAFSVVGDLVPGSSAALLTGWNLVGYNNLRPITASELASMVDGTTVVKVSYLDPVTKMYKSFLPGFHKPGSVYDFTVTQGRGYLISVAGPGTLSFGTEL
ncbi:MAG TPA: SdrD B-like domain-containing protein, partial [Candidatus Paceibacterota bacterium]|nr:SdrD B-like domain-containing protein [Candidatus Paceibacterota bacterium]